jgi:signal transduction histidine kinase
MVAREHARHLLVAQEAERAWFAREMEEDALQRVAVVRAEVEAFCVRARDARRLAPIRSQLDALAHVLRTVAHQVHPSLVERAGLVAGLRSLGEEMRRSLGLTVRVSVPAEPLTVRLDVALAAYRIAQEALRNVARHAGVREAEITLSLREGWLILVVSDRGRGFGSTRAAGRRGLGLVAMQERASLAGGRFEVESRRGRGTSVKAWFLKMHSAEESVRSCYNQVGSRQELRAPWESLLILGPEEGNRGK